MNKTPDINKILALPANKGCSIYGAQMGRKNDGGEPGRLYLQQVRLCNGGYDTGGAYWGHGNRLYCAFNDYGAMFFVRAKNRKEAKNKLPAILEGEYGFFK